MLLNPENRDKDGFYTVPVKDWEKLGDHDKTIDVKVFGQFGFAMLFLWVDEENDKDIINFGVCRQDPNNPARALQEGEVTWYRMYEEAMLESMRRKLALFGFGPEVYNKIYDTYAHLSWFYKNKDVDNLPPCKVVSYIND
jgi:hypothetical protein